MLTNGWRIALLAIGGLAGYGLASGFSLEKPATEPGPAAEAAERVAMPENSAADPADCPASVPDEAQAVAVTAALPVNPEPWDMTRDPDRPFDWYRAYSSDIRDRTWAVPSERRIAETVAAAGYRGYYTEYLRCASRFCAVAGFVDPGKDFDSCAVGKGIAEGGVFRGDLRYSCLDQDRGTRRHFIVFVDTAPRT